MKRKCIDVFDSEGRAVMMCTEYSAVRFADFGALVITHPDGTVTGFAPGAWSRYELGEHA